MSLFLLYLNVWDLNACWNHVLKILISDWLFELWKWGLFPVCVPNACIWMMSNFTIWYLFMIATVFLNMQHDFFTGFNGFFFFFYQHQLHRYSWIFSKISIHNLLIKSSAYFSFFFFKNLFCKCGNKYNQILKIFFMVCFLFLFERALWTWS